MSLELALKFNERNGSVVDHSGNNRGFALVTNTVRNSAGSGYTYGGSDANSSGLTQTSAVIQTGPASMTPFNTTGRTIEVWAKAPGANPSWMLEFYNAANDTGAWGWLILSGTWNFRAKNAANTVFQSAALTQDTANFHHYAATHDGTTMKVYRDGVQVGTDISMPSAVMTADAIRVFDLSGSTNIIDEVRIYSHVLTGAQIATDMVTPIAELLQPGWGIPL